MGSTAGFCTLKAHIFFCAFTSRLSEGLSNEFGFTPLKKVRFYSGSTRSEFKSNGTIAQLNCPVPRGCEVILLFEMSNETAKIISFCFCESLCVNVFRKIPSTVLCIYTNGVFWELQKEILNEKFRSL